MCGSGGISAPYRTDSVIYLSCGKCPTVWPVEVDPSENQLDYLPECQKQQHSHFVDADWLATLDKN